MGNADTDASRSEPPARDEIRQRSSIPSVPRPTTDSHRHEQSITSLNEAILKVRLSAATDPDRAS
jgi:hypothetical protein